MSTCESRLLAGVLALSFLGSFGCPSSSFLNREAGDSQIPDDDGGRPSTHDEDAGRPPCDDEAAPPAERKLDLLLMMDNSGSMYEEQKLMAQQLPRLVQALATGDSNGDGITDFSPISSLHLGVVSSDMGTNGVSVPGTGCEDRGDDGLLRSELSDVSSEDPSCQGLTAESYHSYEMASDGSEAERAQQVASEFTCVARLGIHGCGLEQQLESVWKALAPASDTDFLVGHGHGDEANAGFLRDDAVLAVMLVTDESDCSITKAGQPLFDVHDESFTYQGPFEALRGDVTGLNYRCSDPNNEHLLQPVSRYIDGLLSLRPGRPDRVLFTAIAGVPAHAERMFKDGLQNFDAILALPEMAIEPGILSCPPGEESSSCGKPDVRSSLPREACSSANGSAVPGRRFVEAAKGFGANAHVASICADDYSTTFDHLLEKVAAQANRGPDHCE